MTSCFLTEMIEGALDNGTVVGPVFLDLKKAFDTVNHENILHHTTQSQACFFFACFLV